MGNSPSQRVNQNVIPNLSPGEISGHTYILRDKSVTAGKVYFYKLEIKSADGYAAVTDKVHVKVKYANSRLF